MCMQVIAPIYAREYQTCPVQNLMNSTFSVRKASENRGFYEGQLRRHHDAARAVDSTSTYPKVDVTTVKSSSVLVSTWGRPGSPLSGIGLAVSGRW